jgi:hypothetical protein
MLEGLYTRWAWAVASRPILLEPSAHPPLLRVELENKFEAREPRVSRAEPVFWAHCGSEPSRAGSFQLASRLASFAKLLNIYRIIMDID